MRIGTVGVIVFAAIAPAWAQQAIQLQPLGGSRQLPDRILGANAIPFYEKLIEDPAKARLLKTMDLAFVRFPGGTISQFYQPGTGTIVADSNGSSSSYRNFWGTIAPRLDALHPNGIGVEETQRFLDQIGAAMVLLPNLDTSSVEAQRAWFQKLAAKNLVPRYIEMGNESYLAMLNDPVSLKRFPDSQHYMAIAKQYADAFQPFLPKGAKLAIQYAPSGFSAPQNINRGLPGRFNAWNNDLRPEPWFQAVTVHLYARVETILGGAGSGMGGGMGGRMRGGMRGRAMTGLEDPVNLPPGGEMRLFSGIMGRFDSGVDRIIESIAQKMPGKEIWVTEWNPRGGDPSALNKADPRTAAMMMHASSRTVFALLRHPEVTMSEYFMMNFDTQNAFTVFVKQGSEYRTVPPSEAMSWFNNAANGGVTFQEYAWGSRIPSGGVTPGESYTPVVAGLFTRGQSRTLIVQNATNAALSLDLHPFGDRLPTRMDRMAPALTRAGQYAAEVETVTPTEQLTLPAFSLTRVVWEP